MESLYVNPSPFRNKWYCREGSTQSKRREFCVVLSQSGLDENWWAESMECFCYLRNNQDQFLIGRHSTEGVSVNHSKDRSFLWFVGRISSNIPRGSGTNPSIWKESAPWDIPWLCIVRGGESGTETYWSRILRRWKRWMHQISMLKDSMRKR